MLSKTSIDERQDLVEELMGEMQKNVQYFFESASQETMSKLFEHLLQSSGTIFLTGVGKSGIIAKKIAATMNSSGTKALYLSPLNALHGDVGMVAKGDSVLFFSKSGESDELLHLCPIVRNKGAFLIAVISNSDSRLAKACDFSIELPVARELCPFNIVPTTSTLVQLMFGDLMSMVLMRSKRFTVDEFAQNHPAGRLGKRLTFLVKDLMISGEGVPFASPNDLLINVLSEFSGKKCGCLLIIDEERRLIGIFTDGDLRRSLQKYGAMVLHKAMHELMTLNPRHIDEKVLAFDAVKYMEADQKQPITVLPVVDSEKKVVGIIKMHDIVQSGI